MRRGAPARVAVVDDHDVVAQGVAAIVRGADDLVFAGAAHTLPQLESHRSSPAVVLLDPHLADGSRFVANVDRLRAAGARPIAFCDDVDRLRACARSAHAAGVLAKTAPVRVIEGALRRTVVAPEGEFTVWAAQTVDASTDPGEVRAPRVALNAKELLVLRYYAEGHLATEVAGRSGLTVASVHTYVARIRRKYRAAGRASASRIDLFRAALEDGLIDTVADDR